MRSFWCHFLAMNERILREIFAQIHPITSRPLDRPQRPVRIIVPTPGSHLAETDGVDGYLLPMTESVEAP